MEQRVLLVDDNPNDLELALEALQLGSGHCVSVACGGPEALALLRSGERPDLVLLDLNMPRMDGLEVLEAIRTDARLRDLPVVMLSTSRDERDRAACLRRGASEYVVKPLDFAVFAETLRATLHRWMIPPAGSMAT